MKILFFLVLTLMTVYAQAQTLLFIHEPMSPFCKVMAPLMALAVVGGVGYLVVKAMKGNDKSS